MNTKVAWLQQVLRTSDQECNEPRAGLTPADFLLGGPTACVADLDPALFPADDHLEYLALTPDNVVASIETQLLDCQNLARQHGLVRTAAVLDKALDQLALEPASSDRLAFQPTG